MTNEIIKKRILHVDNDADSLATVKTILEKEGYEVESVLNGKDALDRVDLDGFSLIILDFMMPDMSGWNLFTRIYKIKPSYKIMFLSVLDISPERLKELKDLGIKDFIKKPFDLNDFIARVNKVIES